MRSAIICEGGTDLVLIQYFMEVANKWEYSNSEKKFSFKSGKKFKKDENLLLLGETGGCSNISSSFNDLVDHNKSIVNEDDLFDHIVIISDRDEISTLVGFEENIINILNKHGVIFNSEIENDTWLNCKLETTTGLTVKFSVLLLLIPFKEEGALETFLLNSISDDKVLISNCNNFVETVDLNNKYLKHRRHITKAKFDVYFSIRTPLEQFAERRSILKNVPWEQYKNIQECFKKLSELG